jgi:hypothetical protein
MRIGHIRRDEISTFVELLSAHPHDVVFIAIENSCRDDESSNVTGFEINATR